MLQQVSAVIRTKDSAETLNACIEALLEQTHKISEILVVDSGSQDASVKIAQSRGCRVIHYNCQPPHPPFNYSKALNLGIAEVSSSSEFVLVISSHCLAYNRRSVEWLVSTLEEHPRAPGVSLNKSVNRRLDMVLHQKDLDIQRISQQTFAGFALSNAACLIRYKSWQKHPYNETTQTAEDVDWSMHFIKQPETYVLRVENDYVEYKNPSYSPSKDVQELLYIDKQHYPQGRSVRRLLFEARSAVRWWFKGKKQRAYSHWLYAYYLMWEKTFGSQFPRAVQQKQSKKFKK